MIRRSCLLTLLVLTVSAHVATAQEWPGAVKRPGEVGLTLEGDATWFRSRFGDDGKLALGGGPTPVSPSTFEPLSTLLAATEDFLATVDLTSTGLPASDFLAGDLSAALSWNDRVGAARVGAGVLPRLEIGVGASIYRTELFPLRSELAGGALGLNPDLDGNAALLAGLDATGQAVGGAPVLPLENSPLGSRLQELVFAATGDSLTLPQSPLTITEFTTAFGFTPFQHQVSAVRVGDVEVDARIAVLRTFDGYYPLEGRFNARLTAMGGFRIATGDRGVETPMPEWGPNVGHGGYSAGAIVDVFGGRIFWGSAGVSYSHLNSATRLVPPSGLVVPLEPGLVESRVAPGSEMRLGGAARVRVTREISFGGSFLTETTASGSITTGETTRSIQSRSLRSVGLEVRYTSLPAYQADPSIAPIDAVVGFRTAVSGSGLAPASTVAYAGVTILRRFRGSSD